MERFISGRTLHTEHSISGFASGLARSGFEWVRENFPQASKSQKQKSVHTPTDRSVRVGVVVPFVTHACHERGALQPLFFLRFFDLGAQDLSQKLIQREI